MSSNSVRPAKDRLYAKIKTNPNPDKALTDFLGSKKSNAAKEPNIFTLGQPGAHMIADGHHGHISPQGEQAHAENQQHSAHNE